MLVKLQPDLYQLRSFLVTSHLIVQDSQICLIDGGFLGGIKHIEQCLEETGLDWSNINSILLTHGHLDHCFNLAEIQRRSGATLYAHPLDAAHLAARHNYRGISRLCGLLEASGRLLFSYDAPKPDKDLFDKQELDIAGGIEVIHTPGHTPGHCSFHWRKHSLLFSGDLFATMRGHAYLPPAFLNSCPGDFPASLQSVLDLSPEGILSNHSGLTDSRLQRNRFYQAFG